MRSSPVAVSRSKYGLSPVTITPLVPEMFSTCENTKIFNLSSLPLKHMNN